jgi:CBS domain-containing protein
MAKTIGDILRAKPKEVITVDPNKTVQDAVNLLVEKRIGSLVVTDDNNALLGIITERDVLRECARRPAQLDQVKVSEVMDRQVVIGRLEDTVKLVERLMTERRIRHMPVLMAESVIGIVSIGDVVKSLLEDSSQEADDLRDRLAGHYVVS